MRFFHIFAHFPISVGNALYIYIYIYIHIYIYIYIHIYIYIYIFFLFSTHAITHAVHKENFVNQ